MRRDLPDGTVTFVFTDIEGSTRLLEELGADAYGELLARHHEACRAAWRGHGGVEVDTAGDAFFVAFSTASGALRAASEAQAALREIGLSVRMGLHTGEVTVGETGYVGFEVHRAARIAAAAHGGQVVVSSSTAALVPREELVDLGEHRFKDLAAPERVYQLGDRDHPPLKSLYRSNLPVPATPFLGRERELGEVAKLLARPGVRLVTLTGPGGTGKTRLALQAAAEASEWFPDGVRWVSLSPLRDAGLVAGAVAQAVEVMEQPGRNAIDVVVERLAGRRLLVLLDNAEHLLPGLADTVSRLHAADGPLLMLTSRERLQVAGEHVYPVTELDAPEGVELFVTRAAAAGVTLEVSPVVEAVCSRLEQLPLALELAAARTVVFSPEQLFERLGQRLDLLKAGRDADPRQQTLRSTIEWSYELLDDAERRLLQRLSVFRGGATLEAVENVAAADVDTLQSLVDKSLVRRRTGENGDSRYWMLETIREYAAELLAASGAEPGLRRRHALHYAALVAGQADAVRLWDERAHATALDELDNARATIDWALQHDDAAVAARVVYGLWFFWMVRGLGSEARAAAEGLLRLEPDPAESDEAYCGVLAASEILRATGELERSLDLKRHLLDAGEGRESPDVARWMIPLVTDSASLECELGDLVAARRHAEEALGLRREAGREWGIAHALCVMSQVAVYEGRPDAAAEHLEEAKRLYTSAGDEIEVLSVRVALAECRVLCGALQDGIAELWPIVDRAARADVYGAAEVARLVSDIAARLARYPDSAMLAGFHRETAERAGLFVGPRERSALAESQEPVRQALGADYEPRVTSGRQLSLGDAIDLASDVLS